MSDAVLRKELSSADPTVINAVYDKTGYASPSELHDFPPDRPHP